MQISKTFLLALVITLSLSACTGRYSLRPFGPGALSAEQSAATVILHPNLNATIFTNATDGGFNVNLTGSKTAGLMEIDGMFRWPTNGLQHGSGYTVLFKSGEGDFTFTSPIIVSNNPTWIGQGLGQCVLDYVGPTNIFTISNVTNNPYTSALIQFVTNNVNLKQKNSPPGQPSG